MTDKTKPVYLLGNPDQPKLKEARAEIEAVLKRHDLAGMVLLHTPGMAEFFYDIRPSYSCCWIDEKQKMMRLRSKLEAYDGDAVRQQHDLAATANMMRCLFDGLWKASTLFGPLASFVDEAVKAEHTEGVHVPDRKEMP